MRARGLSAVFALFRQRGFQSFMQTPVRLTRARMWRVSSACRLSSSTRRGHFQRGGAGTRGSRKRFAAGQARYTLCFSTGTASFLPHFLKLPLQGAAAEAEEFGGLGAIVTGALEGGFNHGALHLFEIQVSAGGEGWGG